MTTKKKEVVKSAVKDQIKGKKVANTLVLTINKKLFNKKVSKEEADVILKKVEIYNKKPSDKQREAIKSLMTTKAIAVKKAEEKKEMVKKAANKIVKKESKKEIKKDKVHDKVKKNFLQDIEDRLKDKAEGQELTPEEFNKLEELLFKAKKVEEVKAPVVQTPSPSRGEY